MDANYGVMTQSLTLDEDFYLEFLPDPLLLHRGGAVREPYPDSDRVERDAPLFGDRPARTQAS